MISQKEFLKFEKVRNSGLTNMLDIEKVKSLSNLPRDKIIYILKNYAYLMENILNLPRGKK